MNHDDYTRNGLARKLVEYKSQNTQNLGELFVGFLKYYTFFDYNRCAISIRLGRLIPKSVVKSFKSPKNSPTHWSCLAIEEPFERTNAASAVHDHVLFERIIGLFRDSFFVMCQTGDFDSITPLNQTCRTSLVAYSPSLPPSMPVPLPNTNGTAVWPAFIYQTELLGHPKDRKV